MSIRRKILIAFGIILLAGIVAPIIHHYQLRFAVEAYIAGLKARGEPVDLAQVIPPSVPPEQNGAPNLLKADSLMDTNWNVLRSNLPPAMVMVAPEKALIGWAQSDIHTWEGKNSWSDVESALHDDAAALKLLGKSAAYPEMDFDLNYEAGSDKLLLPDFDPLKRSALLLSAAAMDALHRRDGGPPCKTLLQCSHWFGVPRMTVWRFLSWCAWPLPK